MPMKAASALLDTSSEETSATSPADSSVTTFPTLTGQTLTICASAILDFQLLATSASARVCPLNTTATAVPIAPTLNGGLEFASATLDIPSTALNVLPTRTMATAW